MRLVTGIDGSGNPTAGATLAPGGGSWSTLSDRNMKRDFQDLSPVEVLQKLAGIPIQTWSYMSQDSSIRHLGPMAQDFHAAFGLGEDERHISTVDADGVALAAVQGLYGLLQEQEEQLQEIRAENRRLQEQQASLEERLARLESLILKNGSEGK